jgi:hypothetical protein
MTARRSAQATVSGIWWDQEVLSSVNLRIVAQRWSCSSFASFGCFYPNFPCRATGIWWYNFPAFPRHHHRKGDGVLRSGLEKLDKTETHHLVCDGNLWRIGISQSALKLSRSSSLLDFAAFRIARVAEAVSEVLRYVPETVLYFSGS